MKMPLELCKSGDADDAFRSQEGGVPTSTRQAAAAPYKKPSHPLAMGGHRARVRIPLTPARRRPSLRGAALPAMRACFGAVTVQHSRALQVRPDPV